MSCSARLRGHYLTVVQRVHVADDLDSEEYEAGDDHRALIQPM